MKKRYKVLIGADISYYKEFIVEADDEDEAEDLAMKLGLEGIEDDWDSGEAGNFRVASDAEEQKEDDQ